MGNRTIRWMIIVVGGLALGACRSERVPSGEWGGQHAALNVEETGARIEFDCAHGAIDRPLTLDRRGRLDVPGTYVRGRGGPIRRDEAEDSRPARYRGRLHNRTLELTVEVEGQDRLGPFTLVLGRAPRLVKCF